MALASETRHPATVRADRGRSDPGQKPWPFRVIGILVTSLIFSVLIEWIGLSFFWKQDGINHSLAMLETEIAYLNDDFRNTLFGTTPADAITSLAGKGYYYAFHWTHIEDALSFLGRETGLSVYVVASITMIQVFLVRLGILTFSLPAFVLFSIVGATSGLALRDIRRWSAGREFGGVYHRAKWIAPKAVVMAWIIYLSLPFSIHPNAIILPCAVLFGVNLMIMSASFKKYL